MPTVKANFGLIFASFNSCKVKPLPYLTLELYLCVGQCTTGRNAPAAGRGAIAAAFSLRLSRRIFFCNGCWNHVFTRLSHFL